MIVTPNASFIDKNEYTVSFAHYVEENKTWLDWKHS